MSPTVTDASVESLSSITAQHEDWVIQQALRLLEKRVFKAGPALLNPEAAGNYLRLQLAAEPNEVFAVLFLNSAHEVIAYEVLFKGSVTQTTVYPRVVVQRALTLNASALILAHQHPSGLTTPSAADRTLTKQLKDVLAIVDVRVVDHLVIGKGEPFSFAKAGFL